MNAGAMYKAQPTTRRAGVEVLHQDSSINTRPHSSSLCATTRSSYNVSPRSSNRRHHLRHTCPRILHLPLPILPVVLNHQTSKTHQISYFWRKAMIHLKDSLLLVRRESLLAVV